MGGLRPSRRNLAENAWLEQRSGKWSTSTFNTLEAVWPDAGCFKVANGTTIFV